MPKKHLGYHISHAQRPVSYHLPLHSETHFSHEHAAADRRRRLTHSHKLARNLSFPGARPSHNIGSGEDRADDLGNYLSPEDELHLSIREPIQVLNCVVAHSPLIVTPLEDHGNRFLFAEVVDPSVEATPSPDEDAHPLVVDLTASIQTHTSVEIVRFTHSWLDDRRHLLICYVDGDRNQNVLNGISSPQWFSKRHAGRDFWWYR